MILQVVPNISTDSSFYMAFVGRGSDFNGALLSFHHCWMGVDNTSSALHLASSSHDNAAKWTLPVISPTVKRGN